MDLALIQAAGIGLKGAIEILRAAGNTKVHNESAAKIADALDRLGDVQDKLFDLRSMLGDMQDENRELKARLREREGWAARVAEYELVTAEGSATVYRQKAGIHAYACPACFNDERIEFLQDRRAISGSWVCPRCKTQYLIQARQADNAFVAYATGAPDPW